MFSTFSEKNKLDLRTILFIVFILLSTSLISILTVTSIGSMLVYALAIPIVVILLIFLFKDPKLGFWVYVWFCSFLPGVLKNFDIPPLGPGMEVILGLTWLSIFVQRREYHWENLRNDYMLLTLVWFLISVFQIANPAGASVLGWLAELRFTALNWIMISPLAFILFNSKRDLNTFFRVIFTISFLASIYAIKQYLFGISEGEQRWLDEGADFTHIVFGQLRVFSLFTDAGQFGASQGHMALMTIILAFGPFSKRAKIIFIALSLLFLTGMIISGTRGALFTLMSGALFWLLLTKNFRTLFVGGVMALGFIGFLKYTTIGSGSYQIVRLRTALDPEDASFNARLINQAKLKEMMRSYPFGGGLGVSGTNGSLFNEGNPLASVPPDSYWVKVWVMYGVVGLVIWFGIVCFILGKCCGITWNLKDEKLRIKMIALTSGTAGLFFSSYGNEVMNGFPSCIILFMSWSYVFLSPALDGKKDTVYVSLKKTE